MDEEDDKKIKTESFKDDETEIKHQQTETKREEPIKIDFQCAACNLTEKCDYKGDRPPFAKKINFTEDCYVMRDPFSPFPAANKPNMEHFIVMGSDCSVCEATVCRGTECSFFYFKTFCLNCAKNKINEFPLEIQSKIRKVLSSL